MTGCIRQSSCWIRYDVCHITVNLSNVIVFTCCRIIYHIQGSVEFSVLFNHMMPIPLWSNHHANSHILSRKRSIRQGIKCVYIRRVSEIPWDETWVIFTIKHSHGGTAHLSRAFIRSIYRIIRIAQSALLRFFYIINSWRNYASHSPILPIAVYWICTDRYG